MGELWDRRRRVAGVRRLQERRLLLSLPEVFANTDFQRGLKLFLSPDGMAARLIITHDVDPATERRISKVNEELIAAREAVKGSPLADAKKYHRDCRDVRGFSVRCEMRPRDRRIRRHHTLIFLVMVIITPAFVAALVIVGTIALSLGASFGLFVLIWERVIRMDLHG